MADFSLFWDPYKTSTYNALFNFIIGNRGGGKSYGAKHFVIKRFIERNEQFVYVRRFDKEMTAVADKFFADISDEYPDKELDYKNGVYFVDGLEAGFAMPLSTSKINKSNSYPRVKTIIFDEFIIDAGAHRYLNDEVAHFLELYETIARMRDVRVFFLANSITMTNPYFLYFDITLPYEKTRQTFFNDGTGKTTTRKQGRQPDYLIELVANPDYIDAKKNTRFGKLIAGTKYSDYAVENVFLRDTNTFIEKRSEQTRNAYNIAYKGFTMGVWIENGTGYHWVSEDHDPSLPVTYSFTTADHDLDTMLVNNIKKYIMLNQLFRAFKYSMLRFDSMTAKNIFYELAKQVPF